MYIVIDFNVFASVFSNGASSNSEYKPIKNWIMDSKRGHLIFGGSYYLNELKKMGPRYEKVVWDMEQSGLAKRICSKCVDRLAKELESIQKPSRRMNDHHVVALLFSSNCLLLCTNDTSLPKLLEKCRSHCCHRKRIKIYKGRKHTNLLNGKKTLAITQCRNLH